MTMTRPLSKIAALAGFLMAATASMQTHAVPWCYKGTIVQIGDVNWTQAQILANFTGTVPVGVADAEVYKAFTASNNYASTFAGGGGGWGGYSVPGSGQVRVTHYAPYTLTNMVGPGYYFTSQGVKFKMHKCYTIPPLVRNVEVEKFKEPTDGMKFEPLEGAEGATKYWSQSEETTVIERK